MRVFLSQKLWVILVFCGLLSQVGCRDQPVELIKPIASRLNGGQVVWKNWAERDSAKVQGLPMMLFFYTQRSVWCRDLAERCFGNEDLAREIMRRTMPIWIDADRRPDLFERFGMGGVPSLVFLTPDAQWITGTTYLDPEDLVNLLRRVQILYNNPDRLKALEEQRAELYRRNRLYKKKNPRPQIEPSTELLSRVRDSLKAVVDKGLNPGPEGLLALAESGGDLPLIRFLRSARRDDDGLFVLDVLTDSGPIVDREKHLAVNAQLVQAFAQVKRSRSLAQAMLDYFAIPNDVLLGAGVASFLGDSGQAVLDSTRYAGWNALAVSGLCAAYRETKDTHFLTASRQIFEAIKTRFIQPDGLCAHAQNVKGVYFLEDQAFMMRAGLDLYAADGLEADLAFVKNLADQVMVRFADSTGALRDRTLADDVVSPAVDRWVPSGNGVTAQILIRLYIHTQAVKYQDRAKSILTALIGPNIDRIGYAGALHRALALFVHESKINDQQSSAYCRCFRLFGARAL